MLFLEYKTKLQQSGEKKTFFPFLTTKKEEM